MTALLLSFLAFGWCPCEAQHTIAVPVKHPKEAGKVVLEHQPILFPHEILWYLWDNIGLSLDPQEVQNYWANARDAGEPWALDSSATAQHIPVGLYGDAARLSTVFQVQNQFGLFLNLVLFRPKSVRASRYLLWSCDKSKCFKNRTINKVLRVLVWSLNAAFRGMWPVTDYKGCPLQGSHCGTPLTSSGQKFAVTELRGDWEFHKQIWRFKDCSWKAITPCYRCPALSTSDNARMLYHTTDSTAESLCD